MSRRQQRVEELLRREIAQMLMRGELRDPRLAPASAVSITGVEVSADLSVARVFVDVLTEALRREDVLAALRSGGGLIRSRLGERLRMRRAPELRFEADTSITRGAKIEAILTEMREHGELGPETSSEPVAEPVAEPVDEPTTLDDELDDFDDELDGDFDDSQSDADA